MRNRLVMTATLLLVIVALIPSPTVVAAGQKCPSSDFACFKRKMMPRVGRKITVEGTLTLAKLGWIVIFAHWGVYIYGPRDSDSARMKSLDTFSGQSVSVKGTLRYSPGSPTQSPVAASVPEHFFFDITEVRVTTPSAPA